MSQARRSTNKKQVTNQTKEVTIESLAKEPVADRSAEIKAALAAMEPGMSKSAQIRLLAAKGYSRSEIAKSMDLLYQHVRNVLITPLKRTSKTDNV